MNLDLLMLAVFPTLPERGIGFKKKKHGMPRVTPKDCQKWLRRQYK